MTELIDPASWSNLPAFGGEVALSLNDSKALDEQLQQFLPNQTLFIETDVRPKPFCEFALHLNLPDGSRCEGLKARLVQCVDAGPQQGLLLQLMNYSDDMQAQLTQAVQSQPAYHSEELLLDESETGTVKVEPKTESEPMITPPEESGDEVVETPDQGIDIPDDEEPKDERRMSLYERLRKMNPKDRGMLAKRANRVERSFLIRDTEAQVIFFLLQNPHIGRDEIVEISKSTRINYQIVQAILSNKVWSQNEEIRFNLVQNPKTPLPDALRLLPNLNMKHLRHLAKNWGLRTRLKQAALRLVLERGSG